jgi:hypothetical protein
MAKEDKVFDVATAGSIKPDIGAKPMIAGHKMLAADPMVKTEADAQKENKKLSVHSEKTISAPVHDTTEVDKTDQSSAEEPQKADEATPQLNDEQKHETPDEAEASPEPDKAPTPKEMEDAEVEAQEKLAKIIQSKKYVVPIHQAGGNAVRTFLVTFLIVLLLGSILFFVLVDAGIIDAGISLPFDLL